jgi:hypothetical protein
LGLLVPLDLTIRFRELHFRNDAHHLCVEASIRGNHITARTWCQMNPIAENTPGALFSEKAPNAVALPPISPKTKKAAAKPELGIPTSIRASLSGVPLGADLEPDKEDRPEPVAKPSREDRKSPRIAVPSPRRSCELHVDSAVLPASLMDRSAGGFAVVTDRADGLKLGKKVDLVTDLGRFKVKVVYINKIARPKDASTQSDTWFRLGLKVARSFRLF